VLRLDDDGLYLVEIWQSPEKSAAPKIVNEFWPTRPNGQRLDYIPFQFFGPSSITPDVERPPLLDLINVNLSHYRSSADIEHGRHFTALPVVTLAGFNIQTTDLAIGSSQALISESPEARAQYLEYKGEGLGALEKALDQKESMMAALGSRTLEPAKKQGETAEALRIRAAGEQASLKGVTRTVSHGLSFALMMWADWQGLKELAFCSLNTDFLDSQMEATDLRELVGAHQAGLISFETFYANLLRGEIAREGVTAEQERKLIEAESKIEEM
jgi:hypothetical protein